jgi:hypothetical protein
MLDRGYTLRQAINLFLQMGDSLYGPITTIRQNSRITKKIPWTVFRLTDRDWERVKDARDILKVGHGHVYFILSVDMLLSMILKIFNNTFHGKSFRHFGAHFPHLKTYRQHGKKKGTQPGLRCIRTLSKMA